MTRSLSALAALFFSTAPALAQECSGIGTGGIWIGGNAAGSDISSLAGPMDQLALVLAGNNYVSLFSLSGPTDVRLEAVGNGEGDPTIELYDPAGASVGFDDDGGGGTSSRLETSLQPGTYCLVMSSFGGAPMTGTVRIGRTDHEPLTTGMTTPPATTSDSPPPAMSGTGCGGGATIADGTLDGILPGSTTVTAPISQISGYDFSISEPATISITAENEAADPVLSLKDASGTLLYENDDYDGLNSRIDVVSPLAPGDYCVELRALSDANAPVTVTITGLDPAEAQARLYDRNEAVPPLDGSYPVEMLGEVSGRIRSDVQMQPGTAKWFAVDVTEGGLLLIEAISVGDGDTVLTVYDDLGRQVGYNDDSGEGLDSMVAARVLPGSYMIALTDLQDGAAQMRVVVERYVPAD